jgi:hypothetical protein
MKKSYKGFLDSKAHPPVMSFDPEFSILQRVPGSIVDSPTDERRAPYLLDKASRCGTVAWQAHHHGTTTCLWVPLVQPSYSHFRRIRISLRGL